MQILYNYLDINTLLIMILFVTKCIVQTSCGKCHPYFLKLVHASRKSSRTKYVNNYIVKTIVSDFALIGVFEYDVTRPLSKYQRHYRLRLYWTTSDDDLISLLRGAKNVIACERETAELKCENGKMINILDANYGRTTMLTCTEGPVSNTTCYTEDAIDIISNNCANRQHCIIEAKSQIFGDPCPDTYKYLSILYECVTLTDFKLSVKCEHKTAHLDCESGKVIRVLDANFGRKSRIICPDGPVHTTNCHAKDSLPIVFDECENKQSCSLLATTSVFGDPCPNTNKYLTVRYECVKDTPKDIPKYYHRDESYQTRRSNYFECKDGKEIRKSYVCNGIEDCSDGEDEFDCDYDTMYACEGKTLNLECNQGEVIKIINGNYGRLSTRVCPKDFESRRVNCEAEDAVNVLMEKCDGKDSCNVRSANTVFGDPCPDTFKYTEVHYQCVKDPRRLRNILFG